MLNTSSEYKEAIKKNRILHHNATITFLDGTVTEDEDAGLFTFQINDDTSNNSSFDIGGTIAKKLTLKMDNLDRKYDNKDFNGAEIVAKVGLEVNGKTEWLKKGVFYAEPGADSGDTITVIAYDGMIKFDRPYSVSNLVYPTTLLQIIQDACSCCGVSLSADSVTFENSDFVVETRPDDKSLTFRQILQWVGQISCKFFRINEDGKLTIRWYDTSLLESSDIETSAQAVKVSDVGTGSTFSTDDVVITGIRIEEETSKTSDNESDEEYITYQYGPDGYVLKITGNKLIQNGKGAEVANFVGTKLNGLQFRPMAINWQGDPAVEAGDIGVVLDRRGRKYKTIFTGVTYTAHAKQSLTCGAETPSRLSATRFSEATKIYRELRNRLSRQKTEWEKAIENLGNSLGVTSGLYSTKQEQEDGSNIYYLHDRAALEESMVVWKMTSQAWGVSTDGGKTWNGGMTVDGELITRILSTIGLNADWINTGSFVVKDADGNILFRADCDTGRVDIIADSFLLKGKTVDEIAEQNLKTWIQNTYYDDISGIQAKLDGKVNTYYQSTDPSQEWGGTVEDYLQDTTGDNILDVSGNTIVTAVIGGGTSEEHEGDIWYDTTDDTQWMWKDGQWVEMKIGVPDEVYDKIDGKAQVFLSTPQPPYNAGDLWITSTSDGKADIRTCIRSRESGSFVSSDWINPKYVGDDTMNTFVKDAIKDYDNLFGQDEVLNKLFSGDIAEQFIYKGENGKLYINASFIMAGLLAGKLVDARGIKVTDSNGEITLYIDDDGNITIRANTLSIAGKSVETIANNAAENAKKYTLEQIAALPEASGNLVQGYRFSEDDLEKYWDTRGNITSGVADPAGGTEAIKIWGVKTDDNYVSANRTNNQVIHVAGHYTFSVWLRSTKSRTIKISFNRVQYSCDLTTKWKKFTFNAEITEVQDSYQLFTIGGFGSIGLDAYVYAYHPEVIFGYTSEDIFNLLTNNGVEQGIYMVDGKVFLNGEYLKALSVVADAIAAGAVTADKINVEDLYAIGATIGGFKINSDMIYNDGEDTDNYTSLILGMASNGGYLKFRHKENGSYVNDYTYNCYGIYTPSSTIVYLRRNVDLSSNTFGDGSHHNLGSTYFYGAVQSNGDFKVASGYTKSVQRDTENYGTQDFYCYETPTPSLGDFGESVISEDGTCIVDIDDIFRESVNTEIKYYVFLQKEGEGDCWVSEKMDTYFVVNGTPGLKFAYEIKAKQRNLEHIRFTDESRSGNVGFSELDYESILFDDRESIINEMEGTAE